jgi:hypothetical protein
MVEGIHGVRGIAEQESPLTEVVENERRQHQREPGEANRLSPEMAHVRVERLSPRHHQEHRSQNENPVSSVLPEELDGMEGVRRRQHSRVAGDGNEAERGEGREPDEHDRTEHRPHTGRAVALHQEQAHEDEDRQRKDVALEQRRCGRKPFEGAQNGDRRGDDPVPVEKSGAEDAHPEDREVAGPPVAGIRPHQGQKREDPSFAAVVGAHHEREIFEGNDDDQGPEDEGEDAEDVPRRELDGVGAVEAFPDGVERAGTDVAIHHSESAEGEGEHRGGLAAFAVFDVRER